MKNTLRVTFVTLLSSLLMACGGGGNSGCSAVLGLLPGAGCSTPNTAPVANAGVTQNVTAGTLVTLDGSGSRDANNQSLTYLWQMTAVPAGSLAALSSTTSAKPTFTADVTGNYTVSLVVNDGKASSPSSIVSIYASLYNAAPVAFAGNNQSVSIGSVVTLDGTNSSDADRDALTYKWTMGSIPSSSGATLNSAFSPNPKFTADVAGTYSVILTVNDGIVESTASVVTITASAANSAPVANAGLPQNVALSTTVTLDGTGSSDANNDFITYKWTLITKPAGSIAMLASATSAKPTFRADVSGTYVATLIVNDGKLDSVAAATTVTVSSANSDPIANAGANQSVVLGSTVTLDGTNSTDANRDQLSYRWVMMSKPTTSAALLANATSAKPTFLADVLGTYVITLIVNDGKVDSTTVATTVTVSSANVAPVANAGANQNVVLGPVTLDGSTSSDANGDAISYKWTLLNKPTASAAALAGDTTAKPTFVADRAGIYVASLVVNDGKLDSSVVTTTVTAASANVAPVANAGIVQSVALGPVTLDGSGSTDANGDTLTYSWTLLARPIGSAAALNDITSAKPTFTADLVGVYVASLVVNDGKVSSTIVTTTVTASVANVAPVANAGSFQNVVTGQPVTVSGAGSTDANADVLTYKWAMVSKPLDSTATLANATTIAPSFTADKNGTYVLSLQVNDGKLDSNNISYITVTAGAANVAPVANAGNAQTVARLATVTLDATGSSDANNDILLYRWVLTYKPVGSTAVLSDSAASRPTFRADVAGVYVATLVVNDGRLDSTQVTIAVTATP